MTKQSHGVRVRLGVALAIRTALARWGRWLLLLTGFLGLVAAGWLTLWTFRLARALILPGNLELELHLLESGLFLLLGLDLLLRLLALRRGVPPALRFPGGTTVTVSRPLVVGRRPGAWDVAVDAPMVSARHLEVRPAGGGLEVRDLGSSNGSFVDGRDLRRSGPAVLTAGDEVELGLGGPSLRAEAVAVRGLVRPLWFAPLLVVFVAVGLFLGWRANVAGLPTLQVAVPGGGVGFQVFRSATPALTMFALLVALVFAWTRGLARQGNEVLATVSQAIQLLLVVGIVTLYPLMPREGLRYARAAARAPVPAAQTVRADGVATGEAAEPPAGDPAHRLAGLAGNLAAPAGAPPWKVTFFRQVFVALAGAALLLVLPLWWPALQDRGRRLVAGLSRPILPGVAGGRLGTALHWDLVAGVAAGGLVLLVLLTPAGTSLGHGQRLWLRTPLGTVQSIEVAKALFVLFMAGYFGRLGRLMELVPRTRYLAPFVAASSFVLLATAVQADMGGLLMLALLVSLLFVLATGVSRLVLAVPMLLGMGVGLAALLGRTATLRARLGLWLDPLHHPRGEQVVAGRQLLMSSGWSGFTPARALAWRIPDIHGDLTFAALGERFGFLGMVGFLAAWTVLVVGLLLLARRGRRAGEGTGPLLLGGVAVLLLLQVLTQAGGVLGLMPFTGVPVPWLSQGLTATLVFTALLGLALAGAAVEGADAALESTPPLRRLRNGERLSLAALAVVGALAGWWLVVLPHGGRFGPGGRDYRWVDPGRQATVQRLVEDGVFVVSGSGDVRLDSAAWRRHLDTHPGDARIDLARYLQGLRAKGGRIEARAWLVSGNNPFAIRPLPRGWILGADGEVLAMNDRRGHRLSPLGSAAWHLVGEPAGLTTGRGIEARMGRVLEGAALPGSARIRAFAADIHHGADVRLTILPSLQREAFRLLDGRDGAAVVMKVNDGALMAMASSPAPAPGNRKASVLELPDRAIGFAHPYTPPGSTFKMVVAAADLESRGFLDGGLRLRCRGYDAHLDVRCAHGASHGRENLARALRDSCNIYFANLAVRLGGAAIRREAEKLGFGPEHRVDLLAGTGGTPWYVAPSTVVPEAARNDRDLARLGYGQGPVNATPLAMARVGAAIANGGLLPKPRLVRSIELSATEGKERRVVWRRAVKPARPKRVLPRSVAGRLNRYLRAVFEDPRGTAHALPSLWHGPGGWQLSRQRPAEGLERVPVAGKTGSAWRTRRSSRDDAWMVVWAPADHPKVVVTVLVDDAGTGARAAGPIAMELLRSALEELDR